MRILVLAAFLIISMVGCNAKESTKKKELNVYFPSFASTIAAEKFDDLVQAKKKFEENNKNITVKLNPRGGYTDNFYILNDVAAGSKIDVVMLYDINVSDFSSYGALRSLDDYIDQDTNLMDETYEEGFLDRVKIKGSLYTLPIGFFAQGLLYNKDILKKYQLEPKTNWTWKDFFNFANTINKGDCVFNNSYITKGSLLEPFINSRGLRLVNSNGRTTNVNNSLVLEWYKYEREIWIGNSVSVYSDSNIPGIKTGYRPIESLSKGEFAFLPSNIGITDYTFIKNNYPNIDVMNLPIESETGFNRGNAYSAGIYKKSNMQKEAYDFIKMLISEDMQKSLVDGPGMNPVHKKVMANSIQKLPADKAVIYKNIIGKSLVYYDADAGANAIYSVIQPYFTKNIYDSHVSQNAIFRTIQHYFMGKISNNEDISEANLNELAGQVESDLNRSDRQ
ncbi:MAG: extracellular solute-binding protein [Clostridia bacterium]|nr:extracellular solute-binding protein [Clostridia bacterium]